MQSSSSTPTVFFRDSFSERSPEAIAATLEQQGFAAFEQRRARILGSELSDAQKLYWLLEDCKRYGTLPFAGLARAAFIATQLLRSLQAAGALGDDDIERFLSDRHAVSSSMQHDLATLDRDAFLARYGHLRPGTYEITCPRYDAAPELYFSWIDAGVPAPPQRREPFSLSAKAADLIDVCLQRIGIDYDARGLMAFIGAAIEAREHAKFVFTRSVSDTLELFAGIGERHGFDREECAFADIRATVPAWIATSDAERDVLARSIDVGRTRFEMTRVTHLPPLIRRPGDVWSFDAPSLHPTFVTRQVVQGPARTVSAAHDELEGAVVLIESADPGYDWLFSHRIAGFITAYGGVNSHMAVRANELGVPAVIGAGELMFRGWSAAPRLKLDCAAQQVLVLP